MENSIGHDLKTSYRSSDIHLKESLPFDAMHLSTTLKESLARCNFYLPTGIQAAAIPLGIAGIDLLVQAKSGTGKTLIYCTIILEKYNSKGSEPQTLIILPTRELALQVSTIVEDLSRGFPECKVVTLIGGSSITADRNNLVGAKIVVGTPGRIVYLIERGALNTMQVKLLVLDEADKLMGQGNIRGNILKVKKHVNNRCQVIACSATYENDLDAKLATLMKNPMVVSTQKKATILVGIRQFVYILPEKPTSILEMKAKLDAIRYIFGYLPFRQSVLFASTQSRAESYCNYLCKEGWPCDLLSAALNQQDRKQVFFKFREFKTRILLATDLMSRGIDSNNLNLVINLELPTDFVTYLHRIGRAGRFGSKGIAITFLSSQREHDLFAKFVKDTGNTMTVFKFPQKIVGDDSNVNIWDFDKQYPIYNPYHYTQKNFNKDTQAEGWDASTKPKPFERANSGNYQKTYRPSYGKENVRSKSADNEEPYKSDKEAKKPLRKGRSRPIETRIFHLSSNENEPAIEILHSKPHNNTEVSRSTSTEHLPLSSNTIDDASSLVHDSLAASNTELNSQSTKDRSGSSVKEKSDSLSDEKEQANETKKDKDPTKKFDIFRDYEAYMLKSDDDVSDTDTVEYKLTAEVKEKIKDALLAGSEQEEKVAQTFDPFLDYENFEYTEDNKMDGVKFTKICSATFTLSSLCSRESEDLSPWDEDTWPTSEDKARIPAGAGSVLTEDTSKSKVDPPLNPFDDYEQFLFAGGRADDDKDNIECSTDNNKCKEMVLYKDQQADKKPETSADKRKTLEKDSVRQQCLTNTTMIHQTTQRSKVSNCRVYFMSETKDYPKQNISPRKDQQDSRSRIVSSLPHVVYLSRSVTTNVNIPPKFNSKSSSESVMPRSSTTTAPSMNRSYESRGVQVSSLSFPTSNNSLLKLDLNGTNMNVNDNHNSNSKSKSNSNINFNYNYNSNHSNNYIDCITNTNRNSFRRDIRKELVRKFMVEANGIHAPPYNQFVPLQQDQLIQQYYQNQENQEKQQQKLKQKEKQLKEKKGQFLSIVNNKLNTINTSNSEEEEEEENCQHLFIGDSNDEDNVFNYSSSNGNNLSDVDIDEDNYPLYDFDDFLTDEDEEDNFDYFGDNKHQYVEDKTNAQLEEEMEANYDGDNEEQDIQDNKNQQPSHHHYHHHHKEQRKPTNSSRYPKEIILTKEHFEDFIKAQSLVNINDRSSDSSSSKSFDQNQELKENQNDHSTNSSSSEIRPKPTKNKKSHQKSKSCKEQQKFDELNKNFQQKLQNAWQQQSLIVEKYIDYYRQMNQINLISTQK